MCRMKLKVNFVATLLLLVQNVLSKDELLKPCNSQDIVCLSETTQTFLEKSSAGIPQFKVKPIDPMVVDSAEVQIPEGQKVQVKDVAITGLKNLKIQNFSMNTETNNVRLSMASKLDMSGEISVDNVVGAFKANAELLQTAEYDYKLVKRDNGQENFVVGMEKITCEVTNEPQMEMNVTVEAVLNKNKAWNDDVKKEIICKVAQKAYGRVIDNLRVIAGQFPKEAFFTNLA